nr:ABC transporter permease [uncultured Fretibacterium sp.]
MMKDNTTLGQRAVPLAFLVLLFAGLEFLVRVTELPRTILPPPSSIFAETARRLWSGELLPHVLFTLKVVTAGFVSSILLGMSLAAILSQFPLWVAAVTPTVILLIVTPMITLIPLLILWMGNDPNVRIVVVVIQATPIILLNTLTGFTHVDASYLELARSTGAGRFRIFRKIVFPNAMPHVFTGIKLGCIFSLIGAVSADFVAGSIGLGFRIVQYTKYIQIEMVYGTILIIGLIGIILYHLVALVERRIVIWKR